MACQLGFSFLTLGVVSAHAGDYRRLPLLPCGVLVCSHAIRFVGECLQPVFWKKSNVTQVGYNQYQIVMDAPPEGHWRAFYMEARFEPDELIGLPYLLTTQVRIYFFLLGKCVL